MYFDVAKREKSSSIVIHNSQLLTNSLGVYIDGTHLELDREDIYDTQQAIETVEDCSLYEKYDSTVVL